MLVTGGNKGMELDNAASASLTEMEQTPNFTIYPNPSNSDVTLLMDKLKHLKNAKVTIIDVNGQEQYSLSLENIPTVLNINDHQLSQGFYFVKIQNDETSLTQKVEIY